MSKPLSPRFLKFGYWAATGLVGLQSLWLICMVVTFELVRLGRLETTILQASDAQPSFAGDPLIQWFGSTYVAMALISLVALLMRRKWAFWTYLAMLVSHAGVWVALTNNPFVLSYVTLGLLVVESGVLLLIQLLGNAGRLR